MYQSIMFLQPRTWTDNLFFPHCHHYTKIHKTFLNIIQIIDSSILNTTNDDLVEILLFGNREFSLEINSSVNKASINNSL